MMMMKTGKTGKKEKYQEKQSQKQRLLETLKQGKKVCQIDLGYYLALRENTLYRLLYQTKYVDAIAELGIANLPARIFGLKKDGYKIITETVKVKGRFCNTHYSVYSLDCSEKQEQ
jgi:hypothetical protein